MAWPPGTDLDLQGSGTTVVSPTCEVQAGSRNIAVDFGSVPNTTFTGVGSKAVDRDFEIRLNCQGSNVAAYQSKIGIRLDADQDSSNMPGVLKPARPATVPPASASRWSSAMAAPSAKCASARPSASAPPRRVPASWRCRARATCRPRPVRSVPVSQTAGTFTIQYEAAPRRLPLLRRCNVARLTGGVDCVLILNDEDRCHDAHDNLV
jgi:hypothetical protein